MANRMLTKDEKHQKLLKQLSNKLSHQIRQPICTMLGLINLSKIEGVTESERQQIFCNLNTCIVELEKLSREMGAMIQKGQERVAAE